MKAKRYLVTLVVFNLVYFAVNCFASYNGKYFGEMGMTDGQIGLLINGTMLLGMLFQPLWGMAADRARHKRSVLALCCVLAGVTALFVDGAASFAPLFGLLLLINGLLLPASPVCASISIEYMSDIGRDYGPLRMTGTIGYGLGALLLGAVLTASLRGMFRLMGLLLLACAGLALLLPPVPGHQRGARPVSPFRILRDKRTAFMLLLSALCCVTLTFFSTFFTKRLGELGFDNAAVSLVVVLGIVLEIPFLLVADKLMRRFSVWTWMLVGLAITGLRWVALWRAASLPTLIACQIPSVVSMACAEYFPALYIHRRADAELKSSAQTLITLCCSGTGRVVGGLLGGLLADRMGIANGFLVSGALLLLTALAAFVPCLRLARRERAEERAEDTAAPA